MPIENPSTYLKTDPSGRVVLDATTATITGMLKYNPDGVAFSSKDLGVGAIVEASTLDLLMHHPSTTGDLSVLFHSTWANVAKGTGVLGTDGDKHFAFRQQRNGSNYFTAIFYHNGIGFAGSDFVHQSPDVIRLQVTSRVGNIFITTTYNGLTVGSGVLSIMSANAGEVPPDFQFHMIASNASGSGGFGANGYAEDYEFKNLVIPAAVTPPHVFDGMVL